MKCIVNLQKTKLGQSQKKSVNNYVRHQQCLSRLCKESIVHQSFKKSLKFKFNINEYKKLKLRNSFICVRDIAHFFLSIDGFIIHQYIQEPLNTFSK